MTEANKQKKQQKELDKSLYLKLSPSTITYKKLMAKAKEEGVGWQVVARTLLDKGLLNL